jgi:hypothetical protein
VSSTPHGHQEQEQRGYREQDLDHFGEPRPLRGALSSPEIGQDQGARSSDGEGAGYEEHGVLEGVHVELTLSDRLSYSLS